MRVTRSNSQILFGYLPHQTVDVSGRVWKVLEWEHPVRRLVDDEGLRKELVRQASRWEAHDKDSGYVADLRRGFRVDVLELNGARGVRVEAFPKIWICKTCGRVGKSDTTSCRCGNKSWGQLHFVGYHDCGTLRAPWLPRCKQHDEVKVVFPGTASASEIRFECPVCDKLLRRGLGAYACDCGAGLVRHTVHRAASVYTPRTLVVVNPLSPEKVRELRAAGGQSRALEWVLDGMQTRDFRQMAPTRNTLLRALADQGLPQALAEKMADEAVAAGGVSQGSVEVASVLSDKTRMEAEHEATIIATALYEARSQIAELERSSTADSQLQDLYRVAYPSALHAAGLEAVELVDKFPVLTGAFGYTRGDVAPGASRLVPFRHGPNAYAVHAEVSETEALFVRIRPTRVLQWLQSLGFTLEHTTSESGARLVLLNHAVMPAPGDEPSQSAGVGECILTLVHSLAHRMLRRLTVRAGIDRDSVSELLLPYHLGFFLYAASKGDFVLGGLQAMFETELHEVLDEVVHSEHRCAMDPGCEHTGGACACCLHVGEPSCRWFNRFLNRKMLFGPTGFLRAPRM